LTPLLSKSDCVYTDIIILLLLLLLLLLQLDGPGRHRKRFPREMRREMQKAERRRKTRQRQNCEQHRILGHWVTHSRSRDTVNRSLVKVEP